jgi:hypothetical protein
VSVHSLVADSMTTEDSCCADAQSNHSLESGSGNQVNAGMDGAVNGSHRNQSSVVQQTEPKSSIPVTTTGDRQSIYSGHSAGSNPSRGSSLCPSPSMDRLLSNSYHLSSHFSVDKEGHLDQDSLHLEDDEARVDEVNMDEVIDSNQALKLGPNGLDGSSMKTDRLEGKSSDARKNEMSVLSGGSVRGWTPEVSSVLWKRMLCILGDINCIQDPDIHAQVLDCLNDFCDTLRKIRNNLGVSMDNQSTPECPQFTPPLSMLTPWLFKAAFGMPERYKKGKVLAYRLLCNMTVQRDIISQLPKGKYRDQ